MALLIGCLGVALTTQAQWNCVRFHSFGQTNLIGETPGAGLLLASDGRLYGTTTGGGAAQKGVLYQVHPADGGYRVLWHFGVEPDDGANPYGELIEHQDGRLYGTTMNGGRENAGTIFRLHKDGTGYTILRHLSKANDGMSPRGRLVAATNGYLYGTVSLGKQWPTYEGGIFRMTTDGGEFEPLHFFAGGTNDGAVIYSSLLASGNTLFGTSYSRGNLDFGTVFRINLDGSDYRILQHFGMNTNGYSPQAQLIEDNAGWLYGATYSSWSGAGVLFRLDKEGGNYEVLHRFPSSGAEGANPVQGLNWGPDGCLYGITESGGAQDAGVLYKLDRDGGNFAVLRHFEADLHDGWKPAGQLVISTQGVLHGVTAKGGMASGGSIYQMDLAATNYTVLHHFPRIDVAGADPESPLTEGPDGALYGTAPGGFWGEGLVFKLGKAGEAFTVLRHFGAATQDGYSPHSGVLIASDGALYGVTQSGGRDGSGTAYRMNLDGSGFTNLVEFGSSTFMNGIIPVAGLREGQDGWLYGSCSAGGTNGNGTLFRCQKNGAGFTVIRHFKALDNVGGMPREALVQDANGVLYGQTEFPVTSLFRVNPDGSGFTVLRTFDVVLGTQIGRLRGPIITGSNGVIYGATMFLDDPRGTVGATIFKMGTNGSNFTLLRRLQFASTNQANCTIRLTALDANWLYGVVANNGDGGGGLIFRFDPVALKYEQLHAFSPTGISARHPIAAMLRGSDGIYYGVCGRGGDLDRGTIFRLGLDMLNPIRLDHARVGDCSLRFHWEADPSLLYLVEYSVDGREPWLPLSRHQGVSGPISITDTNPVETMRWYRLRVP